MCVCMRFPQGLDLVLPRGRRTSARMPIVSYHHPLNYLFTKIPSSDWGPLATISSKGRPVASGGGFERWRGPPERSLDRLSYPTSSAGGGAPYSYSTRMAARNSNANLPRLSQGG